ncbi:hypothetical protein MCA2748 [Methylococcus capsulatus str. Bath]|uniref:Uncharacterized protein n=1 Tax=Methylococcus capsulatus (strain ATCC 33009 / NCIMB 11132 / Bath) TaxID=243233 RepID=Q603Q3_METCA|nr:hypothetical protein MCA2748 [Methylococcus capsulatus str. Bath]
MSQGERTKIRSPFHLRRHDPSRTPCSPSPALKFRRAKTAERRSRFPAAARMPPLNEAGRQVSKGM